MRAGAAPRPREAATARRDGPGAAWPGRLFAVRRYAPAAADPPLPR